MLTYFIIPARSGSKGIPNKNIKHFKNKPLIQWSIEQSKNSKYFSRVFVSTDSEEYKNIAIDCGAEAPFIRPIEIAQDLSSDYEFIKHFIDYLQKNKIILPDLIVHMRPTYPTRKVEYIDKIIEKFINNYENYDSIRTVIENEKSPYKMYNIINDKLIPLFDIVNNIKEPYNMCRQILPKTYLHNGYLDVIKTESFLKTNSITGDKILSYIMDKSEIDDLDTIEQWEEAEKKI
jgi:CMP-N,N'-diacetyllegionaminic acid synthase